MGRAKFFVFISIIFFMYGVLSVDDQSQANQSSDKYLGEAINFSKQQKFSDAAKMFERFIQKEEAHGNPRLEYLAAAAKSAGHCYFVIGQLEKAIQLNQKALSLYQTLGHEIGIASMMNNMGMVYNTVGDYENAIKYYNKAMVTIRKSNDAIAISRALNNIGYVYYQWGRYDQSLEAYKNSLRLVKDLNQPETTATLMNNIGTLYQAWGKYTHALQYYQKTVSIIKDNTITSPMYPKVLYNIGSIYSQHKKYTEAMAYYKEALPIFESLKQDGELATLFNGIGEIYRSMGENENALSYFQKAKEIFYRQNRESDIAVILNNIGLIYSLEGNFQKALLNYSKAINISEKLGETDNLASVYSNVGVDYYYQEMYKKAIEFFIKSVGLKEKLRKTASGDIRRDYLASQIATYQYLASAYQKTGQSSELLKSIEMARAKLLAERISENDFELNLPELEDVQNSLGSDEAILIFNNIEWDNFILMVITSEDVQIKEVNTDSYFAKAKDLYDDQILLILDSKRGLSVRPDSHTDTLRMPLDNISDFETLINYYRKSLIGEASGVVKDNVHFKSISHLLHDFLIKPCNNQVLGKRKLTIVTDGILAFLPFETLMDDDNQYLVEKYNIRYIQSLAISKMLRKRRYPDRRKSVLAFGGAIYEKFYNNASLSDPQVQLESLSESVNQAIELDQSVRDAYVKLGMTQWNNLPGTLKEVENISKIVSGAEIVTGNDVTENQIKEWSRIGKLGNYKILHFATHGLVVPEVPELSAIVLSQFKEEKQNQDGYLRMGEIADLDIRADFVALSACETGLGKIYGGEGVVGLAQSFLIAGANSLSVSLWQVSDQSTAKFMTEIYNMVQNKNIPYAEAITLVKREFIEGKYGNGWQSPHFWAPFVFYGN